MVKRKYGGKVQMFEILGFKIFRGHFPPFLGADLKLFNLSKEI